MVYTIYSKSRPITIFLIGLLAGIVILWLLWDLNSKIIQELLILIFALILISYPIRNGIELDLSNRKYRRFYSFLSYRSGKWQPLPQGKYISLFKTERILAKNSPLRKESYQSVYKVNFFDSIGNHINFITTKDSNDARNYANELKIILNLPLLDATSNEYKWVEKV